MLRKKPHGDVLASAHAVDREFRVLKALQGRGVPVPRVLCLCEDTAVLGAPFYIMEHLHVRACRHLFARDRLPLASHKTTGN